VLRLYKGSGIMQNYFYFYTWNQQRPKFCQVERKAIVRGASPRVAIPKALRLQLLETLRERSTSLHSQ
jgi:hypothetical protein